MTLNHRFWALIYLATLMAACNGIQNEQNNKKTTDNLYSTDKDDQQMNQIMEIARKRFPKFDSAFESGNYDKDKFSIKVKFPHSNGNEYIWLTDISKVGGHYWGVVSDTPRMTKQVMLGDRPEINDNDVVDWLYGKDSILHGGFTLRLIYSRMSKEERDQEKASFPYRIED